MFVSLSCIQSSIKIKWKYIHCIIYYKMTSPLIIIYNMIKFLGFGLIDLVYENNLQKSKKYILFFELGCFQSLIWCLNYNIKTLTLYYSDNIYYEQEKDVPNEIYFLDDDDEVSVKYSYHYNFLIYFN
jgi:hypothetical protein